MRQGQRKRVFQLFFAQRNTRARAPDHMRRLTHVFRATAKMKLASRIRASLLRVADDNMVDLLWTDACSLNRGATGDMRLSYVGFTNENLTPKSALVRPPPNRLKSAKPIRSGGSSVKPCNGLHRQTRIRRLTRWKSGCGRRRISFALTQG